MKHFNLVLWSLMWCGTAAATWLWHPVVAAGPEAPRAAAASDDGPCLPRSSRCCDIRAA
jgi:hypothetical protein